MVQLIKAGDLERAKPWYMKADIECRYCGAISRLEPTDTEGKDYWYTDDQREGTFVTIKCPTCGKKAATTRRD